MLKCNISANILFPKQLGLDIWSHPDCAAHCTSVLLWQRLVCGASLSGSVVCLGFTKNHRMVGLGRNLQRSPSPTPLQDQEHLDQVAQGCPQACFEIGLAFPHLPPTPNIRGICSSSSSLWCWRSFHQITPPQDLPESLVLRSTPKLTQTCKTKFTIQHRFTGC